MTWSPAAARLAETHRLAQTRLGARTAAQIAALCPLLDLDDLDGTTRRWLDAVLAILADRRRDSADLAAAYLGDARTLALPAAPPFPASLATALPEAAVVTSLIVTGPQVVRAQLARLVPADQAADIAQASSARAGMRHALNGGRDTITATVRSDPAASGYRRVASGSACSYCAGLAGIEFGDDHVFRPHDGCGCTAAPVYRA